MTLERLKELNATTGKRNGDEDLGHWADREKRENMWVRDVALPDLLAVVEAAISCLEGADNGNKLRSALAKLEGEVLGDA